MTLRVTMTMMMMSRSMMMMVVWWVMLMMVARLAWMLTWTIMARRSSQMTHLMKTVTKK